MSKTTRSSHFLHNILNSQLIQRIFLIRLVRPIYFPLSSNINDFQKCYASVPDHWDSLNHSARPTSSYHCKENRGNLKPTEIAHTVICSEAESDLIHLNSSDVMARTFYILKSNLHASEQCRDCDKRLRHHYAGTVYGCNYISKRFYSSDNKSLFDDLLKSVLQNEMSSGLGLKATRSNFYRKSLQGSNPIKRLKGLFPHLFSETGELLPTTTIEKQLMCLMQMWEMEEAVELLKESVTNNIIPDRQVILDLLQQLANLGEVSCLLELHEFLKDKGLTTNLRFYHCLRDAYFNSGRIEEGFAMLRIVYHGTRDFEDADMFFTLLATMTLKHFDHRMYLIEDFVRDLEESDPPVLTARASQWRCFVLAEHFGEANSLLEEHTDVTKMVPEQVNKLINSPLKMDYNHDAVLMWLIDLPLIKRGLKASVFDKLIKHKSDEGEWVQALEYLSNAMEKKMKIQPNTVELFLTMFLGQLSDKQVKCLSDWAETLDPISEDNGD